MTTKQEKPKLMVQNVSCIVPQTDSLGGIYIGNTYGADNPEILKQYGIRAVLTTSIQTPTSYVASDIPFHLKIQAHDKNDYEMIQHLEECLEFIHRCRQVTNVFVHCYAGVSRSVTIVVAYLMRFWGWGLKVAIAFVQAKRIVAKPNDGFMEQLRKYEEKLFAQGRPNSTPMVGQPALSAKVLQNNQSQLTYTQPFLQKQQSLQLQPTHVQSYPSQHSQQPQPASSHSQSHHQYKSQLKRPQQSTHQPGSLPVQPQQIPLSMTATKRHSETPIPKILTSKNLQRKEMHSPTYPYPLNERYHSNSSNQKMVAMGQTQGYGGNRNSSDARNSNSNTGNLNNIQVNSLNKNALNANNIKSAKVLIRPKDLPGYKN